MRGTKFRHLGRDRSGVDCAGLIVCAYRAAGIQLVDDLRYAPEPDYQRLEATAAKSLTRVQRPEDGDVVLMRLQLPHAGILDGGSFWHVLAGRTVLCTPLRSIWRQRVTAYYGVRRG